jgi:hypothetical protein
VIKRLFLALAKNTLKKVLLFFYQTNSYCFLKRLFNTKNSEKKLNKSNKIITVFFFFSSFFKTVKKINNLFTVFSRSSATKLNRQPRQTLLIPFCHRSCKFRETSLLVYSSSPSNSLVLRRRRLKHMQSASISVGLSEICTQCSSADAEKVVSKNKTSCPIKK